MEKHECVLELMKSKGGRIEVSDPDLHALLGRLIYRLSVYMSFIRRFSKLEVCAERAAGPKRNVTAYALVEVNPTAKDDSRWQSSKYLHAPATPPLAAVI